MSHLCSPIFFVVSLQGPHQRSLLKNLLKDYNRMERPVANDSQPLTVVFTLSLIQIMDVVSLSPQLFSPACFLALIPSRIPGSRLPWHLFIGVDGEIKNNRSFFRGVFQCFAG